MKLLARDCERDSGFHENLNANGDEMVETRCK